MHAPREPLPRFIEPTLLQTGLPARLADDWALELKWDGLRAQLRVDATRAWTLRSRPGRDCSAEFPELAELATALRGHQTRDARVGCRQPPLRATGRCVPDVMTIENE